MKKIIWIWTNAESREGSEGRFQSSKRDIFFHLIVVFFKSDSKFKKKQN